MSGVVVQLSVLCKDTEAAARVMESVTRIAVGLASDGTSAQVSAIPYEDDDEDG